MGAVVLHVLILWVAIAVGFGAARLHRTLIDEPKSGAFGASAGFIASMFGLLLGLLVVTATNHYSDARAQAQTEATAIVALVGALDPLKPAVALPVQHDAVCYARLVIDGDWHQMEMGRDHQAISTRNAGDQLRLAIDGLPDGGPASAANSKLAEAFTARQRLLFLAKPSIPAILWVLIYIGAAVLMFLIASDMVAGRPIALAGLGSVVLMLSVVVGTLTTLDRPFSPLARVHPVALQSGLDLMSAGRESDPAFRACT